MLKKIMIFLSFIFAIAASFSSAMVAYATQNPDEIKNETPFRVIGQTWGIDTYVDYEGRAVLNFIGNEDKNAFSANWGLRAEHKYDRGINNLGYGFTYEGLEAGSIILLALQGYQTVYPTQADQKIADFIFIKIFRGDNKTVIDGSVSSPDYVYYNLGSGGDIVPLNSVQEEEANFNLLPQCAKFPYSEVGTVLFNTTSEFDLEYILTVSFSHGGETVETTITEQTLDEIYDLDNYSCYGGYIGGRVAFAHYNSENRDSTVKIVLDYIKDSAYTTESYEKLVEATHTYYEVAQREFTSKEVILYAYSLRDKIDIYSGEFYVEMMHWALEYRQKADELLEEKYTVFLDAELNDLQIQIENLTYFQEEYAQIRDILSAFGNDSILSEETKEYYQGEAEKLIQILDEKELDTFGQTVAVRRALEAAEDYNRFVSEADFQTLQSFADAQAMREKIDFSIAETSLSAMVKNSDNSVWVAKKNYNDHLLEGLEVDRPLTDFDMYSKALSAYREACYLGFDEQEEWKICASMLQNSIFCQAEMFDGDALKPVQDYDRDYLKLTETGLEVRMKRSNNSNVRVNLSKKMTSEEFYVSMDLLDFALLNDGYAENEIIFYCTATADGNFADSKLAVGLQPMVEGGFQGNLYIDGQVRETFLLERKAAPVAINFYIEATQFGYILNVNELEYVIPYSVLAENALDEFYFGVQSFFNSFEPGNVCLIRQINDLSLGNWPESEIEDPEGGEPQDLTLAVVLSSIGIAATACLACFITVVLLKKRAAKK